MKREDTWVDFINTIFDVYYLRLCEFSFRIVGCQEAARDIAQDAFVVLLEQRGRVGRDPTTIKSYLFKTVKHMALNRMRHERIAARINHSRITNEAEEAKILSDMLHAEVLAELHSALNTLPKGCAQVCKMAYLENKKNQEIADSLGLSINTIKTQRRRAITLLREKLIPHWLVILVGLFS